METLFSNFIDSIFMFLIDLLSFTINIFLFPINALFDSFFPNFSDLVSNITSFITYFATMPINYILHIIPPTTRTFVIIWLVFYISYYSFLFVYRGFVIIPTIIRKVKFW